MFEITFCRYLIKYDPSLEKELKIFSSYYKEYYSNPRSLFKLPEDDPDWSEFSSIEVRVRKWHFRGQILLDVSIFPRSEMGLIALETDKQYIPIVESGDGILSIISDTKFDVEEFRAIRDCFDGENWEENILCDSGYEDVITEVMNSESGKRTMAVHSKAMTEYTELLDMHTKEELAKPENIKLINSIKAMISY